MSFRDAIIQPETSFVKHFFQIFFVTGSKRLYVSGEKNAVFGKNLNLS